MRRTYIGRIIAIVSLVAASTVVFGAGAAHAATFRLSSTLSGANEVPPNASPGTGTVAVDVDVIAQSVCVSYTFAGLTANATGAHIHLAPPGVSGPIVIPFSAPPAATNGTVNECVVVPNQALLDNLAANPQQYYFNIHSVALPGGELRGQLGTESFQWFHASLRGSSEVPPNASAGTGDVFVGVDTATGRICVDLRFANLGGNTIASHIHNAPAGVNGPVVFAFGPGFPLGVQGGVGSGCGPISTALASAIVANPANYYFNIHTNTLPGGEIRGQLAPSTGGLSVTKTTAAVDPVAQGTNITYNLTITVTGDGIPELEVIDNTPANTTYQVAFVIAGLSGIHESSPVDRIRYNGIAVPPGTYTTTLTVQVNGAIPNGTAIINTLQATQAINDTNTADNTSTVTSIAATCSPNLDFRNSTRGVAIQGTPGDDVICGSPYNDTIQGLGGNDIIFGFAGNDMIQGGDANDQMYGGAGDDTLQGPPGVDSADGGPGKDICKSQANTNCELAQIG
jgi:hypothetical protein